MKQLVACLTAILLFPIVLAQQLPPSQATFVVSSIILYPVDIDYTGVKNFLGLRGDKSYLNIFWNATYEPTNPDPIAVECWLNCPYTENIEVCQQLYQGCTYIGDTGPAACTIENPVYMYAIKNNITCKFYNPNWPEVIYLPYVNRSFLPLDFSLVVGGGSYSVGQTITWRVSVVSYGLLASNYTINVTSYNPNVISVQDGYGQTERIYYGQVGSTYPKLTFVSLGTATLEVLARPTEDPTTCNSQADCPVAVYGNNKVCLSGVCWRKYEVPTMQASYAAMPEYDATGVLQIILISCLVFFLVAKASVKKASDI